MSREKILIRTSWVSTIGNAILSVSKIVVGLLAGSLAVIGDGIDSATDVVISVVMIFTARLMNKPPSKKYVFGYEKAESIATKVLSLVIFMQAHRCWCRRLKVSFRTKRKRFHPLLPSMLRSFLLSVNFCCLLTNINKERK